MKILMCLVVSLVCVWCGAQIQTEVEHFEPLDIYRSVSDVKLTNALLNVGNKNITAFMTANPEGDGCYSLLLMKETHQNESEISYKLISRSINNSGSVREFDSPPKVSDLELAIDAELGERIIFLWRGILVKTKHASVSSGVCGDCIYRFGVVHSESLITGEVHSASRNPDRNYGGKLHENTDLPSQYVYVSEQVLDLVRNKGKKKYREAVEQSLQQIYQKVKWLNKNGKWDFEFPRTKQKIQSDPFDVESQ